MRTFSLNDHALGVAELHHNLSASSFYEQRSKNSATAVLVVFSLIEEVKGPLQSQCVSLIVNRNESFLKCLRRHTTFPRIQARAATGEEDGSLSWALLFWQAAAVLDSCTSPGLVRPP